VGHTRATTEYDGEKWGLRVVSLTAADTAGPLRSRPRVQACGRSAISAPPPRLTPQSGARTLPLNDGSTSTHPHLDARRPRSHQLRYTSCGATLRPTTAGRPLSNSSAPGSRHWCCSLHSPGSGGAAPGPARPDAQANAPDARRVRRVREVGDRTAAGRRQRCQSPQLRHGIRVVPVRLVQGRV